MDVLVGLVQLYKQSVSNSKNVTTCVVKKTVSVRKRRYKLMSIVGGMSLH